MERTRYTPRQLDLAEDLFVRIVVNGGDYMENLSQFLNQLRICGITLTQEELQSFVMATGMEIENAQLRGMGLETVDFDEAGEIAKGKAGY